MSERLSIARAREIRDNRLAWAWLLAEFQRNVKLRITQAITLLGIKSLTRCIIFQLHGQPTRTYSPPRTYRYSFAAKAAPSHR